MKNVVKMFFSGKILQFLILFVNFVYIYYNFIPDSSKNRLFTILIVVYNAKRVCSKILL